MNMESELSKRVATGVIGGALLLGLIIFGGRVGVSLLGALLSLAMIYEFVEMTMKLPDKKEKRTILMGSSWLIAFANFWIPRAEYELLLFSFLALFTYFLFTADRHEGPAFQDHFRELVFSIFGVLYLVFLPLFLPLIRDSAFGTHWTILFLLIVWAGDSGAYFAGKKYGKTKLYPAISPKKTIEGGLGGLGAGLLIAIIYKLTLFSELSFFSTLVIPVLIGVVSQIGDLCESFLKRASEKKDSGSILPGHGGFLDRFDGVVFSLPVMYGCIRVFG